MTTKESNDQQSGGFTISSKMMMQIAALATAGAVGGGGISFMAAPKDELAGLKNSVDVVALTLQEIKSDMKHARNDMIRIEDKQKDFESRIRTLERFTKEH